MNSKSFFRKFIEKFSMNKVIALLTLSDVFSWGIYLSITSLVGLYLEKKLGFSAVETVGVGVGIYYLVRAIAQIPIGLVTDNIKRDRDDLLFLTAGNLLMGLPFLFYPVIQSSIVFYLLQAIFGLGTAMNLVTWRKLFARNLDKNREGVSYALYDTIISGAIAAFSVGVGLVANISQEYFDGVMLFFGIVIMASSILPALIFDVRERKTF